jgi:GH24 family phage-related lysozyme (muramidase)
MNNFKTAQKGLNIIKHFEGLELTAYLCPANVWTIGYGHTKTAKKGMKIDLATAETLLVNDLAEFEASIKKLVKVPLNQNQFDALVAFVYNLGSGAFSKSTLLKLINENKMQEAAEQFLRWNKAAGKVLAGLTRRREAERLLFLGKI